MAKRHRPTMRLRKNIQPGLGQKESASSVCLAKEDTASAYSTNTHQGVSTEMKNTNTLPVTPDSEYLAALAGSRIARIFHDDAEAPVRAPFVWKVEYVPNYSHADRWFETETEAWKFALEQAELERKFVTERPAWATDTDSNSLSGHGDLICIHMATVAEGAAWSVDIQRIDTQTPAGVTLGPVEVIPTNAETPLAVDELLAFSAALAAAAVQLAVLSQ